MSSIADGLHRVIPEVIFAGAMLVAACSSGRDGPAVKIDPVSYVTEHPELDPQIAEAIMRRDVVLGMTPDEVRAAGGRAVYQRRFDDQPLESWLVSAAELQLGHYRYHNALMLRLVFENGRLVAIQPID